MQLVSTKGNTLNPPPSLGNMLTYPSGSFKNDPPFYSIIEKVYHFCMIHIVRVSYLVIVLLQFKNGKQILLSNPHYGEVCFIYILLCITYNSPLLC